MLSKPYHYSLGLLAHAASGPHDLRKGIRVQLMHLTDEFGKQLRDLGCNLVLAGSA